MPTLPETKACKVNIENEWLTISFNQPEKRNALTSELTADIKNIFDAARDDLSVRGVTMRGEGGIFCAGGDLYSFSNSGHNLINEVREFIVSLHGAISKFCRIKAPIIASINGVAAGAGLSFASFPSFAIASENATFVSSYTNVG